MTLSTASPKSQVLSVLGLELHNLRVYSAKRTTMRAFLAERVFLGCFSPFLGDSMLLAGAVLPAAVLLTQVWDFWEVYRISTRIL